MKLIACLFPGHNQSQRLRPRKQPVRGHQRLGLGDEAIQLGGETVGELGSVGWSPAAGACAAQRHRRYTREQRWSLIYGASW